ncbi:glycosyl transferase family protein [Marinobacterium sedimentorum]|uniref:glycosyl transferase family protein n=1 Tax=Marinobacterium sedimentorum TaxID=2927804 RepID=UPI0020C6580A|nr:glycosyl transferase family protein [Marinobacterium sedimentorum]MCP8686913.1 glycosyl transferase family protein [Marinobacterium sedimentorum]
MSSQEHPFAVYVRILGKGKKGSRSLTTEEARDAMGMILDGKVLPEQLGAFLMLLRVKEEAPQELCGFVTAVRERLEAPQDLQVELDWSSYAGKKRRLPWFLLASLALAQSGVRVFMHGARGHMPGRLYTEDMLGLFGLPSCHDWAEVAAELNDRNFAFMSIDALAPQLGDIIQLRSVLGLRSPVHTLCRLLNPLGAERVIDGVFHPPYGPMHQKTSMLLGMRNSLTVKGDGGEAELKPDSDSELQWILGGEMHTQQWPRLLGQRVVRDESLQPQELLQLWRGELEHEYGEGAVINTLAAVLKLLGRASEPEEAVRQAQELWRLRIKDAY